MEILKRGFDIVWRGPAKYASQERVFPADRECEIARPLGVILDSASDLFMWLPVVDVKQCSRRVYKGSR